MIPTLDVRAAGACAPRGIRIPATALKGRRPRPLDDGGSDLHREHCIVAAAIRTSSGEYGAKRLDGRGREMHPIRTVVAGALASAMTLATYQVAAAQSLQGEIQDPGNVDLVTVSVSDVKSTYRRFADLVKQLPKEGPQKGKNAFKRLRHFYDKVADGDIQLHGTSQESVTRSARDVGRGGQGVARL